MFYNIPINFENNKNDLKFATQTSSDAAKVEF